MEQKKETKEQMEKIKTELLKQLKQMDISSDNIDWVKEEFNQIIDEEVELRKKQLNDGLIIKYEKLLFLENIPTEDKLELSQLFEDFTKFLINVDNCEENFQTLFIPITKKLYTEFKETDFIKIFEMYSEWCVNSKLDNDYEIVKGFMTYYKSKR